MCAYLFILLQAHVFSPSINQSINQSVRQSRFLSVLSIVHSTTWSTREGQLMSRK